MMQIAICDDEHQDLAVAVAYIEEFLGENKLTADLRQFDHAGGLHDLPHGKGITQMIAKVYWKFCHGKRIVFICQEKNES